MEANPASVAGSKMTLAGVDDGLWSVEWCDTLSGKRIAEAELTAAGAALLLQPPAFQADIAARLKKR